MKIVGRKQERDEIQRLIDSNKSEFVVVYGRRRVGKTYLIREHFESKFSFYSTGLANKKLQIQLSHFYSEMRKHPEFIEQNEPQNWMQAFHELIKLLERSKEKTKLVFIDELPWMDTRGSDLITALDFFWNAWASARSDVKLIVCGSSASWMINNLLKNTKGLYNRITRHLKIKPFTLTETAAYFEAKNFKFDHKQIVEIYMALGGIPYYLDLVRGEESATQNINRLFFSEQAPFKPEFNLMFASLFKNFKNHLKIIDVLASKNKGYKRQDLVQKTGLNDGGSLTNLLRELEESDFIRSYPFPGKTTKDKMYQLNDNFVLFYLNFSKQINGTNANFWKDIHGSPTHNTWAGLAFESLCLNHIANIKSALGIEGIQSEVYAWADQNAQIDLVIDRKDRVINLIELKYSEAPYQISAEYDLKLRNKIVAFKNEFPSSKALWLTLISTYGLASQRNAGAIHSSFDMTIFFTP
jgi:predicted AAA+ superfamily ATPase